MVADWEQFQDSQELFWSQEIVKQPQKDLETLRTTPK